MIKSTYIGVDGELVLSVNGRPRIVDETENLDFSKFLESTTLSSEMMSGYCRTEYAPALNDDEIKQLRRVVGTDGTWETWKMMGANESAW